MSALPFGLDPRFPLNGFTPPLKHGDSLPPLLPNNPGSPSIPAPSRFIIEDQPDTTISSAIYESIQKLIAFESSLPAMVGRHWVSEWPEFYPSMPVDEDLVFTVTFRSVDDGPDAEVVT